MTLRVIRGFSGFGLALCAAFVAFCVWGRPWVGDARAEAASGSAPSALPVPSQPGTLAAAGQPSTEEQQDSAEAHAQEPQSAQDGEELTREQQAFLFDLRRLTAAPHRLAGSPHAYEAAEYITAQLAKLGLETFFVDMPVWQTETTHARLEVHGREIAVLPLRPNVSAMPLTGPDGIKGPLLYAGKGRPEDYGKRSPEGAIVVLDYDSHDAWQRAFSYGASAVLFLGKERVEGSEPKHSGLPANWVRAYVAPGQAGILDLEADHPQATLTIQGRWRRSEGRNVVARVRGTAPTFASGSGQPEALLLSASYDSFGIVPELSPGARGAANVAALLQTAEAFSKQPPKRDTIFVFFDNQARYHQGAREFYEAWLMGEDQHREILEARQKELLHVRAMEKLLVENSLLFQAAVEPPGGVSPKVWLRRALVQEANFKRDDVRKVMQSLRLAGAKSQEVRAQIAELEAEALRWDELRRALHKGEFEAFVREKLREAEASPTAPAALFLPLFTQLKQAAVSRFGKRLNELTALVEMDRQRAALRKALTHEGQPLWLAFHAHFNLSDRGPTWGVVVGDHSHALTSFRAPEGGADAPGYYGRLLGALDEASRPQSKRLPSLSRNTLSDPLLGLTFAAAPFVSSSVIAGSYGIYNFSLMTGADRRPRDGHPSDTLENLHWRAIQRYGAEASEFLHAAADYAPVSLPRVLAAVNLSRYPSWSSGRQTGDYAALQVSGSLSEDRPAAGAMLAIWPGSVAFTDAGEPFTSVKGAQVVPDYDPIALEPVDQNGRFRLLGLRKDIHTEVALLGTLLDSEGGVRAITTQETLTKATIELLRVNLFFGQQYRWIARRGYDSDPKRFKLLRANSDALFRTNRGLWGQLGDQYFAYISDQIVDRRVKVFQVMGPAVLGQFSEGAPYGSGVEASILTSGIRVSDDSAGGLWQLNEARLSQLRTRGVTSADLEVLHGRALRTAEQGRTEGDLALREGALARSAAVSQRVYLPLRNTMDDLVHAIVMLLLLAIPFAFALERLTICATTIYGRLAGFTGIFLLTFGLLFLMHPGFSIAATPVIIFLAFAILLLSSLVTYIVIRKFKAELKAIQGQALGVHNLEVSRMGTILAAVGMGMSTMRRRPMRTTLTAVTVLMLTFTTLVFASFTEKVGVRQSYEGPRAASTRAGVLVRQLDYSPLLPGMLDMMKGQEGVGGLLAPQYWLTPDVANKLVDVRFTVARVDDGRSATLDAVMGVSQEELTRWPELASTLGQGELQTKLFALGAQGVYLPPIVRDVLGLEPLDKIVVNGRAAVFAGVLETTGLQRLKHLDGQSVLPVDFRSMLGGEEQVQAERSETELALAEDVTRDFVHLSADQVAIASDEFVRGLGGKLHSLALYPGPGVDVAARGRDIAQTVVMPVWAAGAAGVERLLLTKLTEVSGGLALFVPLLLGGLIIFGTLLGSISDREKEIYTFSALGLSPGHVGVLFLAEAAVYAVVGGMGGQLLAQTVALAASWLAEAGHIKAASINFSSTNSLFAIGVVMLTVLVSAIYPAVRASRSANPGLSRAWRLPEPENGELKLKFPFTVSAYDITGVVSFLAEHFRAHDDAGLGNFAASTVEVRRGQEGGLELSGEFALAPFDLGVTQRMTLTSTPSEIEGVDEIAIHVTRQSGAEGDWYRANRVFLRELRQQFLLWRTLSNDMIEQYRMHTLEALGPAEA